MLNYKIVKKSNKLLKSRIQLNSMALKLMSVLITNIRIEDDNFFEYRLEIKDFKDLLGNNSKDIYKQLKISSEELMKTVLFLPTDDPGDFYMCNFISSAKYEAYEGAITFKISEDLKPFLLDLKDNFLQYELSNILSLKGSYTIKLYEVLKGEYNQINNYKNHKVVNYTFNLEEMRETFLIPKSYNYTNIRKLILENAQNQFREKCDISFTFTERKKGRKIAYIDFTLRDNNKYHFDYLKNIKTFIKYIRLSFINANLFVNNKENLIISVCPKGHLYNKRNNLNYSKDQAQVVWNNLYTLAKDEKLEYLK